MAHYILSYGWWESYDPHYFDGPNVDWPTLCNSLVEPAALRALESKKGTTDPIGWQDVVEQMVEILGELGFTKTWFPEACFQGTTHISRPEDDEEGLLSKEILDRMIAQTASHEQEVLRWLEEREVLKEVPDLGSGI